MKYRRLFALMALLLTAACAVILPYFFLASHRFTKEQFNRLGEGMTKGEVISVLGSPPGDYTAGKGDYRVKADSGVEHARGVPGADALDYCWCGQDGMIAVVFDEGGRLAHKSYYHVPATPNVWTRIKRSFSFDK